jgi:hypothetical protein
MVEETKQKQDKHEHGSEPEPKPDEDLLVRASVRPAPLSVCLLHSIYLNSADSDAVFIISTVLRAVLGVALFLW